MTRPLIFLLLATLALPVVAQNAGGDAVARVNQLKAAVAPGKQIFMARQLQLSNEEDATFWPVYDAHQAGLADLAEREGVALTIVGLPWTFAAWRIGAYTLWPFGREVVWRDPDAGDIGSGPVGVVLNVIWFIFAGWYIALSHLIAAFFEAITIIGIPFAIKDLELAKLALAPVGRTIRDKT